MRALVYVAPGKVEMQDRPRPVASAGEVEIAVEVAGICGSDISGFLGHSARRQPGLVLGHELVGKTGDGRRVVANPLVSCGHCAACLSGAQNLCPTWRLLGMDQTAGSFAEYVTLPASQVYEIPEAMPSSRAVLTEPLANIVHLFRLLRPEGFFRMAIVGGGVMGTLALLVAKRIGCSEILMCDVNDERLASTRQFGADHAVNTRTAEGIATAREIAAGGLDIVLDASGAGAARQMAFDLCRPGGQVLLLGMAQGRSEIDFVTSIRKEHRVVMSFAYTPLDFVRALELLASGALEIDGYTRRMALEDGQQGFELLTQNPGSTLKVMLTV
jgi:threonine dehydrogenase-like Zn-dependent dehydrogenase